MTAFHTRASVLPLNEKHGYFQYADAQGDVSLEFANGAVQLFISLGQEATRAYDATGLTPAQLQARVAELEEELMQLRAERNSAEMDDEQAAWELRDA